MAYKWCIVPQCISTTIKTPEKLFVSVPKDSKRRKKWLLLSGRDPNSMVSNSAVYMCENHFDSIYADVKLQLEKDIANYMKYKMGFSQKILLADEVLPSKFDCQQDRKRRLSDASTSRAVFVKRQRMDLVKECEKESLRYEENIIETCVQRDDNMMQKTIEFEPEELSKKQDKETITNSIVTAEKSIQIAVKVHYRSKAVQTMTKKEKHVTTSPFKVPTTSTSVSPLKIKPSGAVKTIKKSLFPDLPEAEKSDSDVSYVLEAPTSSGRTM